MEHALINELIKLLCKAGGESFVGNFQKDIDSDGNHDQWTPDEIAEAVDQIRYMNEYFGKDEAVAIVTALIAKYNIDVNDLALRPTNGEMGVGKLM
jgi:hypothetical protein